jgi:hypothetical protein
VFRIQTLEVIYLKKLRIICSQSNSDFEEFKERVRSGKEELYLHCYKHKKPDPNCYACLQLNYIKLFCKACNSHQRVRSFKTFGAYVEYECINGHINRRNW